MKHQSGGGNFQYATITVRALAAELGRDLQAMYRLCNAQQIYADGPDTEIGHSAADRLRDAHEDYVRRAERVRSIPMPSVPAAEQPLTGAAAAAKKKWPAISKIEARKIAKDWTRAHSIDAATASSWWAAGLGQADALLATVLTDLGVQPEHLSVRVRGETILDRLQDGMQPERVARILCAEGVISAP